MTEFELIARYFDGPARRMHRRARLGIGDDCALLAPAAGHELAVSTDMLVAGRHFFDDVDAAALGWKTLAVNLSDLAAMGARPLAFTLAFALPAIDEAWLAAFSQGLFDCATAFDCELVGGDTTRGPLTLCVTVFGTVPEGRALRRAAAREGDDLWVSGELGTAALALQRIRAAREGRDGEAAVDGRLRDALERPVPRVALGIALVGLAHAAIDISDGLAQDLGHLLKASRCGADVHLDAIPVAAELAAAADDVRHRMALAGGDDYELCFSAAPTHREAIARAAAAADTRVTRIGTVVAGGALRFVDEQGADCRSIDAALLRGFDHFA